MVKWSEHASQRFYERTDQDIPRKTIADAIKRKELIFIKKVTNSKTIIYVTISDSIFKILYHKKSKKIVTVLPWNDIYINKVRVTHPEWNKTFEVTLYPDCYLTTENSKVMTEIYLLHNDHAKEPIGYNHPMFDGAFEIAWKKHLEDKEK